MKPPLFTYYLANSVEDAVQQLAENPGARIIAGGQSLIPAMNFRLASPDMLVDIGKIPGLNKISIISGAVVVGANVRHRDLELSSEVFAVQPILRQAIVNVAHVPIRHRGTSVGSICHADAAAETPMILILTDGWVTVTGPGGSRKIKAQDLFKFHMTTAIDPDEMAVSAHFPILPDGAGCSFREFSRRKGDYALAAVGAIVKIDNQGRFETVRLAACGIASTPKRLTHAEDALIGQKMNQSVLDRAAKVAGQYVTAPDDTLATNAYRRHLLSGLLKDVVAQAAGLKAEVPT